MNKKIVVRVTVVMMATGLLIQIKKRSKTMKLKKTMAVGEGIKDYVEKAENIKVVQRDENGLSDADKRELKERFEGMSPAEIDIFMSLVPVELCIAGIQKELDKAKRFEESINAMIESYTK